VVTLTLQHLFSVRGKTALVTGASGFLGRTLSETLLANGARVFALARSDRLAREAKGWSDRYGEDCVEIRQVDMYDLDAFRATLEAITTETPVDILVNNAHEMDAPTGFGSPLGTLDAAPVEQWMKNLTGGVLWPALATQLIGGGMRQRTGGTIINIASMYAVVAPNPRLYEGTSFSNPPGYSAAKAGMLALTRYTASFWGAFGVRANAILPGPFSNLQDGPNSVGRDDPFVRRLEERTLLRRLGSPHELAGTLLYLASDASSYVTGQALIVDGGWTAT
jgi:NAD(P)-dependent dehydrogenase (short-subunit alcohol dehydrogenase family)